MLLTGQILKRRFTFTVRRRVPVLLLVVLFGWLALPVHADDLDDARKLLLTGKYPDAIRAAEKGVKDAEGSEDGRICIWSQDRRLCPRPCGARAWPCPPPRPA